MSDFVTGLGRWRIGYLILLCAFWIWAPGLAAQARHFGGEIIPALILIYGTILSPIVAVIDAIRMAVVRRRGDLPWIAFVLRLGWAFVLVMNFLVFIYFVTL